MNHREGLRSNETRESAVHKTKNKEGCLVSYIASDFKDKFKWDIWETILFDADSARPSCGQCGLLGSTRHRGTCQQTHVTVTLLSGSLCTPVVDTYDTGTIAPTGKI